MDERQLIARILHGDPAAERQLYDVHVERIYRLAYRMTGDATAAEDVTQEAFLRAFDRLHTFRGEAALSTWLHAVATSVILNHLRKRTRVRRHEVLRDDLSGMGTPATSRSLDLRRELDEAIAKLSDKNRLVFIMHAVEGYTHDEIAAVLGIPVGTTKARLSRARKRLRDVLRRLDLGMEREMEHDTGSAG